MPDDVWGLAGGDEIAPGLTAVKDLGGGTVYEAWLAFDDRLHAPVVVKALRPGHVADPVSRAGLEREVALLARLAHPGLTRVFSYDDEAARPYFVLEHVEGPNLSRLISRHGAVPEHQLLPLALELASVLHYLHGQGVVHLDVKPSNVIMGAPAQLVDLSVALDVDDAAALDHPVGSDEYMAPEQCAPGERGTVGPAADVWGLGATLFRAAAGFRAFDREPRWAQLHDEPKPLPGFVHRGAADLIARCLDRDPAQRPTPRQIALELEPMIAGLPSARLSGFTLKR
ncbi:MULTISPECIES: serine/threonine-protein kinase [unclassified Aeromicrobium]|jgi:serine/threonine-protein kinase|uniref:serine/threonine-protein kinase n=1 Tax=unclassified Aeromicrobium TaxID=2633570 RepID=UPI000A7B6F3E|nr:MULTISPECIES: serine/threonine-protein kinase [unclassified Aeromicrobium]